MSVVNDVLKDLHDRHRQQRLNECLTFVYDEPITSTSRIWSYALVFSLVNLCVISYLWFAPSKYILSDNSLDYVQNKESNNEMILPLTSRALSETQKIQNNSTVEPSRISEKSESDNYLPSQNLSFEKLEEPREINNEQQLLIENNQQKSELAVPDAALNLNSISDKSKAMTTANESYVHRQESEQARAIANSAQSMADENRIRYWLKNQPEKVWPYIQNHLDEAFQNTHLLALAAQAEQRSQRHASAIDLYKKLILAEPTQGRWKIGLAISLESTGQIQVAKALYEKGISQSGISEALKNFALNRLKVLKQGVQR